MVHVGRERRADRAANQNRFFTGQRIVDGFPTGLGHVVHRQAGLGFRRAPVARDVDGNTPVPCREMRHLENPARLVHWIGMNKSNHRPRASHPLVIKRSINVLRHVTPPGTNWVCVILG